MFNDPRVKRWLPIVLVLLAGVGVTFALTDSDGDGKRDTLTVTVKVDGIDKDTLRDDVVQAPAAAVDRLADKTGVSDLADGGLDAGDTPEPSPLPLAAQAFPGCRTQFVRNQSSRNGTSPRVIVWHYTVSADTPGWNDNNALTGMANNPANGVSWHFSIGRRDGNCAFNVPLSAKAWTQANANPFSVGIEVIATGKEGVYVEGAGKARLLQVTREIGKRLAIPMQRGLVSNCRAVKPGIIRHVDLGACGGGHVDTGPFPDPIAALLPELRGRQEVTVRDRHVCKRVRAYRVKRKRQARRGEKPAKKYTRLYERRLERERKRGFRCRDGKVSRR